MGSTTFSGPVTSTNGFVGTITGNVTGSVTGNVTGNITSTGTSVFSGRLKNSATAQIPVFQPTPDSITTAGAGTYTIANLLNGILLRDPNGGSRTDTLPTAALVVAGMSGCAVGDSISCTIINTADAAETITLAMGSGGTAANTGVTTAFDQNTSKTIYLVLTNVTASSEAYTVYA